MNCGSGIGILGLLTRYPSALDIILSKDLRGDWKSSAKWSKYFKVYMWT